MTWSHVQNAVVDNNASSASLAITVNQIGAGNVVVGMVLWDLATATVNSITDNKGNTYTLLDAQTNSGGAPATQSFALGNIQGGPTVITLNLSASTLSAIVLDEYSNTNGPTLSSSIGVHTASGNNSISSGQTVSSGTTSSSAKDGDLICGFCANESATGGTSFFTSTAAYTSTFLGKSTLVGWLLGAEFRVLSPAAVVSATFGTPAAFAGNNVVVFVVDILAPPVFISSVVGWAKNEW